jgi:hypothetical protein
VRLEPRLVDRPSRARFELGSAVRKRDGRKMSEKDESDLQLDLFVEKEACPLVRRNPVNARYLKSFHFDWAFHYVRFIERLPFD